MGVSVYNIPMEKDSSRPRPQASARNKMMDFLARRDHSEKELRKKLKSRFTPEEIEKAIQYGKENGWLPNSPEDTQALSEKTASELRRKGKGTHYINHYLKEKGLPQVAPDFTEELDKARELVKNKFSDVNKMDRKDKAKVGRFLASRGFPMEIVRKVIYEPEDVE
ncbi:MAG: regulatory protein RecX [Pseudobdellovibrionaceae bacterium]